MSDVRITARRAPKMAILEIEGRVVGKNMKIIDPAQVKIYASLGCKDSEICDLLGGLDSNSLRYNFKQELLAGKAELHMSLRRKQIEVAMSGNPTMLIWLGKNVLGQSDAGSSASGLEPLPWSDTDLDEPEVEE